MQGRRSTAAWRRPNLTVRVRRLRCCRTPAEWRRSRRAHRRRRSQAAERRVRKVWSATVAGAGRMPSAAKVGRTLREQRTRSPHEKRGDGQFREGGWRAAERRRPRRSELVDTLGGNAGEQIRVAAGPDVHVCRREPGESGGGHHGGGGRGEAGDLGRPPQNNFLVVLVCVCDWEIGPTMIVDQNSYYCCFPRLCLSGIGRIPAQHQHR